MSTLDGIDLQIHINKIFRNVMQEEWPPDVCEATADAYCEVVDHCRGLVTFASIGGSYTIATDGLVRWPPSGATPTGYDRIQDRTPAGIEAQIRVHLRYMKPRLENVLRQARQGAS